MKTMTINLTDNEFKIIEDLCEKKGISKVGLVRQSIRLYQNIHKKIDAGEKLMSEIDDHRKNILIL